MRGRTSYGKFVVPRSAGFDGNELPGQAGEAHYAVLIQPGETIHASGGRRFDALEAVATEDEAYEHVGLLTVEVN